MRDIQKQRTLNGTADSYLAHFKYAQLNFILLVKEERIRKRLSKSKKKDERQA